MASLRKLKKAVNSLADQLLTECDNYKKYNSEADIEKIAGLKTEINEKRIEIIKDINNAGNGDADKKQFEKVIEEFQNTMIPILDKLVN